MYYTIDEVAKKICKGHDIPISTEQLERLLYKNRMLNLGPKGYIPSKELINEGFYRESTYGYEFTIKGAGVALDLYLQTAYPL